MKLEVDIALTPEVLARAFCDMNDEAEAQFFVEVARIADKEWRASGGLPERQWQMVGAHLVSCACATYESRELVRSIAFGMDAEEKKR